MVEKCLENYINFMSIGVVNNEYKKLGIINVVVTIAEFIGNIFYQGLGFQPLKEDGLQMCVWQHITLHFVCLRVQW